MKLKLYKKQVKTLSQDTARLPGAQTKHIAGGGTGGNSRASDCCNLPHQEVFGGNSRASDCCAMETK
ncbi:hypothetical protein A7985_00310 [Pseudoalteromonas luteoviolacea]|uniref:Uncharacterized protein n=1 Tax=Pseudoalteromonas luteoviolacea TaxID=43657 RepID=A0A1C0TSZ0_9GAMM|nr:hypothetical protein [Pseudoalteromonas luteoviolacea]MBQ4814069.1 hypothetical protein [Pseudoalteromonas luteoviolacea]OCQ22448.1 hypothetical protein A7985_00310 [Pseudoalteromonas luteoviolacea]